jgi:hypothetical protein
MAQDAHLCGNSVEETGRKPVRQSRTATWAWSHGQLSRPEDVWTEVGRPVHLGAYKEQIARTTSAEDHEG